MQRLKKKFALLLMIFLCSCGSIPKRPQLEICAHDEINKEVECYDNQTDQARTLSISETDKYIMFSPDDWGLVLFYIGQLERRIKSKNIKTELKKIIKTSEKHKGIYGRKIRY